MHGDASAGGGGGAGLDGLKRSCYVGRQKATG